VGGVSLDLEGFELWGFGPVLRLGGGEREITML